MKPSSGPRKSPSNLSESVHQHLNMYAISATAAGVSLLALAQPSEAKIVYTPANVVIGVGSYDLDLDHNGTTDFTILGTRLSIHCEYNRQGFWSFILESATARNGVAGAPAAPLALPPGTTIGTKLSFGGGRGIMAFLRTGNIYCLRGGGGNWYNVMRRYLGLKFYRRGKAHYGWARLNVTGNPLLIHSLKATLTGYAYETIPGKSIKAGRTKGESDEWNEEDFGSAASFTNPTPDAPQPASLGTLALGANGVPLWRRKESALEGELKGALL